MQVDPLPAPASQLGSPLSFPGALLQAFPTAPGAQQLRDFHIGLPYGLLCVTAAVLGSCPVIGAAGCAVLGASWCSLQEWKQQHRAFGGFLHWFAGAGGAAGGSWVGSGWGVGGQGVLVFLLGGLPAVPLVSPPPQGFPHNLLPDWSSLVHHQLTQELTT